MARLVTCLLCACAVAFAGEPASPFKRKTAPAGRQATVAMSDGRTLAGTIGGTRGKPLRVFHRADSRYVDVPIADVADVLVEIEKNVTERIWRWKESASDEKVYTDNYYVWHKYVTTVTRRDGTVLKGDLQARVYVKTPEKRHSLDLHKRLKGKPDTKDRVKAPVYIRRITFGGSKRKTGE